MEISTFAKQVLFGKTLEEKLTFPRETLTDDCPGAAIKTPSTLARPGELQFKDNGIKLPPPRLHQLTKDKERGKLLHFFCNHELLATELMALALLKFPEAPKTFRLGLLETLKEEQIHTQLYIARMKQCGIHFGDLPVNGYFWKNISTMNDPLDYVTRLSLTFEQANLDYSQEYARVFNNMGDTATATILDKIYRDEINHVGFGLKWFRQWKAKGTSDWDAYKAQLTFPLSPSRAKGIVFNAEGRREAGLDATFIDQLSLFHQSKGRTPAVYYFNPGVEIELASLNSNTAKNNPYTQAAQNDFSTIPIFLAQQDDVVLMPQAPSFDFLKKLKTAGIPIPEIIETQPGWPQKLKRKLDHLRPWAWSPRCLETLKPLVENLSPSNCTHCQWNQQIHALYDKTWGAQWLKKQIQEKWSMDWMIADNAIGQTATDIGSVLQLIDLYREIGYKNVVIKTPFSVAGRDQQRILAHESLEGPRKQWLEKKLKEQTKVLVEPWLERVFDFSIQFEKSADTLKTVGITPLHNTPQGQFQAASTKPVFKDLPNDINRFLQQNNPRRPLIFQFFDNAFKVALDEVLTEAQFQGPLGVDAFVFRDINGELKLKPVVEINPRFTMGRVALELQRHTENHRCGRFEIISLAQMKKEGHTSATEYAETLESEHPITHNEQSKIRSGAIVLNDPGKANKFLMIYRV